MKEKAQVEEKIDKKMPEEKAYRNSGSNSDSSVEYFTYGEPTQTTKHEKKEKAPDEKKEN